MKISQGIKTFLAIVGAAFTCVSVASAQYGSCEVPAEPCSPNCEQVSEPTCEPTCGYSGSSYECGEPNCFGNFCGLGNNYDDYVEPPAIIGCAVDAVISPFRWVICALNDGIYPNCGCAPRPPKSNCNPCDVCGNFVGGCEDCSASMNCCNSNSNYFAQSSEYAPGYNSEEYDASPSHIQTPYTPQNNGVEELPTEAYQSRISRAKQTQAKAWQALIAAEASKSRVRSVSYENKVDSDKQKIALIKAERARIAQEKKQNDVSTVQKMNRQNTQRQSVARSIQNKSNVRIVAKTVKQNESPAVQASAKTFGKTRPIK